jgi:hypothetical protein
MSLFANGFLVVIIQCTHNDMNMEICIYMKFLIFGSKCVIRLIYGSFRLSYCHSNCLRMWNDLFTQKGTISP